MTAEYPILRPRRFLGRCLVVLACLLMGSCGPLTFVVGVAPGGRSITQTTVQRSNRLLAPRVAIIDLRGMIRNSDSPQLFGKGENPVSLLHEKLEKARRDGRVKAVVLRLNSPGGTVAASDTMYQMVKRFKQQSNKPVVALITDMGTSGAYYVACAADEIIAYPTAITGSIGVIFQTVSLKTALTRLGVHAEAITTGPNKNLASPLSDLTDDHRHVLRSLVDDFYQRFLDVVRQARPAIPPGAFDRVTDGRVVTGRHSVELGLVDRTGDLFDALAAAQQLAGTGEADLVVYHRPLAFVGSPYTVPRARAVENLEVNLAQINLPGALSDPLSAFYYLWQPRLSGR